MCTNKIHLRQWGAEQRVSRVQTIDGGRGANFGSIGAPSAQKDFDLAVGFW